MNVYRLEVKLQENDIVFVINDLVESIPDEAFHNFLRITGCPAYHPRIMIKVILCAYTQSIFSGRKIEALLKDSIRMMWLTQGYEPSYRTINCFRVDTDVQEIIRQLFIQFRCQLIKEKIFHNEAIMYDELLEKEIIPEIKRESPDELSINELEEIVEKLDEKVNEYDKEIENCEVGNERKKIR